MIDIPRIRAFLVAAECLNFTEAAKRLYVTQPTLSKQVALIEDDLGFKLFIRSNRNVSLTPEGAYLYKRMRRAIDDLDSSVLLARTAGKGEGGTLRVGCFETLGSDPRVRGLFARFAALCPDVDLRVEFRSFRVLRERLMADEVDVIITKKFEVDIILEESHVTLFSSDPVVVVGESHPLAGRERISISDLNGCSFIAISPAESLGAYNALYSCCNMENFPPNVSRYVEHYDELCFYLCLEPCAAVMDQCDTAAVGPGIRVIPLDGIPPQETVAAWKRSDRNTCLPLFRQVLEEWRNN